jgi:hypothetical protein
MYGVSRCHWNRRDIGSWSARMRTDSRCMVFNDIIRWVIGLKGYRVIDLFTCVQPISEALYCVRAGGSWLCDCDRVRYRWDFIGL